MIKQRPEKSPLFLVSSFLLVSSLLVPTAVLSRTDTEEVEKQEPTRMVTVSLQPVKMQNMDNATDTDEEESSVTPSAVNQNDIENVREMINEEREQAREKMEEAREQFEEKRDEILEKAKERLLERIDQAIERLTKIQERLTEDPRLDPDKVSGVVDELSRLISQLESLKTSVTDAQTREDLKAVHTQIVDIWHQAQATRARSVGLMLVERFSNFLDRIEQTAEKVEAKLDELEAAGVDVSAARVALTEFQQQVDDARASIGEAQDLFNSITFENHREVFHQGVKLLQEAKANLFAAGKTLRETIAELRHSVERPTPVVTSEVEVNNE